MSAKYTVTVPPAAEMGSYVTNADNRADALRHYNSARAHDGLLPLSRMPTGTKYTHIEKVAPAAVASVHRFRDKVAVYVGNGQTTYLSSKQAEKLAAALRKCATSVKTCKFVDSSFGTVEINQE